MNVTNRVYMALVKEWANADIEHNYSHMGQFRPWCLSTYGAKIYSRYVIHFDDPDKEFLFKLKYSDLL